MEKFMSYILMVLIAGFFTAIVLYAAQVFFPVATNTCWEKYSTPYTIDKNMSDPKVVAEQNAIDKKVQECNTTYESVKNEQDRYKLILVGAINVLVLLIIIFFRLSTIGLGLAFGVLLCSIIATAQFFESSSKIALVIVVVEFILCMFLAAKFLKKDDEEKETKTNKSKTTKKK